MNTNKDFPLRLKTLREKAGLDQGQMADALKVGRSYYNGLETGRNKRPSDRLVHQVNIIEQAGVHLLNPLRSEYVQTSGSGGEVRETSTRLTSRPTRPNVGVVALRLTPGDKRQPSTQAECEAYFAELMAAALASDNPNAWPVIHDRLLKKFPLSEWQGSE